MADKPLIYEAHCIFRRDKAKAILGAIVRQKRVMLDSLSNEPSVGDTRVFFECYKTIVSSLPGEMLRTLRLYLDDGYPSRINHLSEVLTMGLCSDQRVFVEGFEIGTYYRVNPAEDVYYPDSDTVIDLTSDSRLEPEKMHKLRSLFPGVENRKVVFIKPAVVAHQFMRRMMRNIVTAFCGKSFAVAREVTFGPKSREDWDTLSTRIKQKTMDTLNSTISKAGPPFVQRVNSERLKTMIAKNNASSMALFEKEFEDTYAYEALSDYLKGAQGQMLRPTPRVKGCCNRFENMLDRPVSDPLSNFILRLHRLGPQLQEGWYEYIEEEPHFRVYPNKHAWPKKAIRFFSETTEPAALVKRSSELVYEIIFNISTLMRDFHITDALTRNTTPYELKRARRDLRDPDFETLLTSGEASMSETYDDCLLKMQETEVVINPQTPAPFHRLLDMSTRLTPNRRIKNFCETFNKATSAIFQSEVASGIAHEYELAKSLSSSFFRPAGRGTWTITENGELASISLVQRNCTNDNFTNSTLLTTSLKTPSSSWCTSKSMTFNRNTLDWALKKLPMSFSILHYILETRLTESVNPASLREDMFLMLHLLSVNRDSFAQVSDLTRYLYTAALSHGSSHSEVLKKLKGLFPVTAVEAVYVMNMVKVSASLNRLKTGGHTKWMSKGVDFCMPQDRLPTNDFSYYVSSMFVSRLYNKNKAFPEPASALCYKGILDELEIYNSRCKHRPSFATFEEEMDYCLKVKGERYVGSPMACAALTKTYRPAKDVKESLARSSLTNALNNRAAMRGCGVERDSQASKSFISTLEGVEGLISDNPDATFCTYYLQAITMIDDYLTADWVKYCSYIVHKDQVGNREIYVMNFHMRLGTYFVEEVAKIFSMGDPVNLQNSNYKDKRMEDIMRKCHQLAVVEEGKCWEIYDNADAKRWGPNMDMEVLAALFSSITTSDNYDIASLGLFTFKKMTGKRVKVPQCLIAMSDKCSTIQARGTASTFIRENLELMTSGEPCTIVPMGMGQGLFQEFSSILHSIKLEFQKDVMISHFEPNLILCEVIATSDDSFGAYCLAVDEGSEAVLSSVFRVITEISVLTGCWFSILRNLSKSGLSLYIAEFNSRFFFKRSPAMPTIKFRSSKLDCGAGSDMFTDLCSSLRSSEDYLSWGGSLMGGYILSICNYYLFLSQWRVTLNYLESLPGSCSLIGRLSFIDPLMCLYYGPLMNVILSDLMLAEHDPDFCDVPALSKNLTRLLVESSIRLENPSEYPSMVLGEDQEQVASLDSVASGFYCGFSSLCRTPPMRSAFYKSQLEEKCKNSEDGKIFGTQCLSLYEAMAASKNRAKTAKISKEEVSFHKRFSDPWISRDRKIFSKVDSSRFSRQLLPEGRFSFNELITVFSTSAPRAQLKDDLLDLTSELPEHLSAFSEVWEDRLRGGIQVLEMHQRFDALMGSFVKRPMPKMSSKFLESPSVDVSDRLIYFANAAAQTLGTQGVRAVLEVTRNLEGFVDLLRIEKDCDIDQFRINHEIMKGTVFDYMPGRRVVLIPDKVSIASAGSLSEHILRDRFLEGGGYEDVTPELTDIEASYRREASLIKSEAELMSRISKKVSTHLNSVFKGEDSDLASLIRDEGLMSGDIIDRYLSGSDKSKFGQKRVVGKLLRALMQGTEVFFDDEESQLLAKGRLSVASRIRLSNGYIQYLPHTTFVTEGGNNATGMHIVNMVSEPGKENVYHHVIVLERKFHEGGGFPCLVISSITPGCGLNPGDRIINGSYNRSGDPVLMLFPEDLSGAQVITSSSSSAMILKVGSCLIPLFPLLPDAKTLECLNILPEDSDLGKDLTLAAVSRDMEWQRNPRSKVDVSDILGRDRISATIGRKPSHIDEVDVAAWGLQMLSRRQGYYGDTSALNNMVSSPFMAPFSKDFSKGEGEFCASEELKGSDEVVVEFEGLGTGEIGTDLNIDFLDFDDDDIDADEFATDFVNEAREEFGMVMTIDSGGRRKPLELARRGHFKLNTARSFVLTLRKALISTCLTNFKGVKGMHSFFRRYSDTMLLSCFIGSAIRNGGVGDMAQRLAFTICLFRGIF